MRIDFFEIGIVNESELKYAVICAVYKDKWIYVRHQDRNTWEIPGGHREANEPIDVTASRELYEETGALKYTIIPVGDYSVTRENGSSYGRLYFARIQELGKLPEMEIKEVALFEEMPENLTYPLIQPHLLQKVKVEICNYNMQKGDYMETDVKIEKIKEIVEQRLSCSAHNLDHVHRVYKLSLFLAEHEENVDMEILIPAVLLHDIARVEESEDITGETDHALLGSVRAEEILRELEYQDEAIEQIKHCITAHRFRTGNEPKSIEAKILYDADKLDALGAVGIARCFMVSGKYGQRLSGKTQINDYMANNTGENGRIKDLSKHTPFIEYEYKFKKIPAKLYTQKAREIGCERLKVMDKFFEKLNSEVEGLE